MNAAQPNEATCLVGLWGLDPGIWKRPGDALADEPELARAGLARSDGLEARGGDPDTSLLPSSDMVQPLVDLTLPGACLYAAAPAELPFSMAELTRYVYPDGIRLRDDTYAQFAGCSGADMHHFFLEGSRLFGHVITRHCLVTDVTKQALLRMQLGARDVLRRPAGSSVDDAEAAGISSSGLGDVHGTSGLSSSSSSNPLAAALDAHEPSSIVLLTAECWIDAMRSVMLSYDRWLWRCAGHPSNLPYEPRHVRLLLRVLIGDVAAPTQPSFMWTLPAPAQQAGSVAGAAPADGVVVALRRYFEWSVAAPARKEDDDDDSGEGLLKPAPRPLLAWFVGGTAAAPAPGSSSEEGTSEAEQAAAAAAAAAAPVTYSGSACRTHAALMALLSLPHGHVFPAPVDSACSELSSGLPEMASLHLSLPWVRALRSAAAAASTQAVLARDVTVSAVAAAAPSASSPVAAASAVAEAHPTASVSGASSAGVGGGAGLVCYTSEGGVTTCARPTRRPAASPVVTAAVAPTSPVLAASSSFTLTAASSPVQPPLAALPTSTATADDLLSAMLTPAKHLGDLVPEVLVLPLASLPSNPVAFSWEIPQRKEGTSHPMTWHCPSCARDMPAPSRRALRAAAVDELRALASYAAAALCCGAAAPALIDLPPLPPPPAASAALPRPLQGLLRCVETGCCYSCAAVTALGVADSTASAHSSSGESALPAVVRAAFPLLTDGLWAFVAPSLGLTGQEHTDVLALLVKKLAAGEAARSVADKMTADASADASSSSSLPLPFRLPSWSGLSPLDVDPRHLFARVSPANLIATLTALLVERKVLVVCSDRSVLADIMYTLLDLFAPLTWAGTSFTFPPDAFTFLELVRSSPQPWFGGATPAMVAAAAVEAEAEEEHAAAVLATEALKGAPGTGVEAAAAAPGAAPVAPTAAAPSASSSSSQAVSPSGVAAAAAVIAAASGSSGGGTAFPLACTPLLAEVPPAAAATGGLPPLPPSTLWWRRYSHLLGTRAVEREEARVAEELAAARAGAGKRRESVLSRLFSPGPSKKGAAGGEGTKGDKKDEDRWAHRGGLPCLWELAKEGLTGAGEDEEGGGAATPRGHRTYSTASDGGGGGSSARGRRTSGAGGEDDQSLDGEDDAARGGFFSEGAEDDGRDPQSYPVVILDTDVDEVALHHLPGLYQLPLVLQARLWDAVLRWANLFTWAHPSHLFVGVTACAPPTAPSKRASVRQSVTAADGHALAAAVAAAAASSDGGGVLAAPLCRYIRCRKEGGGNTTTVGGERCETTHAALSCIKREWVSRAADKGWRPRGAHPPQRAPHAKRRVTAPLLPGAPASAGPSAATVLPVWCDSLFAPGSASAALEDTGSIGGPGEGEAVPKQSPPSGKGGKKAHQAEEPQVVSGPPPVAPLPLSIQSVLAHISSHTSGVMLPPPPAPGAEAAWAGAATASPGTPLTPAQKAIQLGSLFACPATEAAREEQDDDALPEGLLADGGRGAGSSGASSPGGRSSSGGHHCGGTPHDPLDCRPIVVHPPWALWRARVVAWEVAGAAVEAANDIAAGRPVPSQPHLLCLLPPVAPLGSITGGASASGFCSHSSGHGVDLLSQALPSPSSPAPGGRWALYVQPPVHFTRVKLAFLKTWTRLFSGYRSHMRRDVASRVEASSVLVGKEGVEQAVMGMVAGGSGGGGGPPSTITAVDAPTPAHVYGGGAGAALLFRSPSASLGGGVEGDEEVALELKGSGSSGPATPSTAARAEAPTLAPSSRWGGGASPFPSASGYATPDSSFDYDLIAPPIKPLPVEAQAANTYREQPRTTGSRLQRSASFLGPLSNSSLFLSLACLQKEGASTVGEPSPSSTWSKLQRQRRGRGGTEGADDDGTASVHSAGGVGAGSTISSVGSGTGVSGRLLPVSNSRLLRRTGGTRGLETRQAVLDSVSLLLQMAPVREAMALSNGGGEAAATPQQPAAAQLPPLVPQQLAGRPRRGGGGVVASSAVTPSSASTLSEGSDGTGSTGPTAMPLPSTPMGGGFGTMAFSISAPPVRDRARSVRLALAAVAAASGPSGDADGSRSVGSTSSNSSLRQRGADGVSSDAFTGVSEEEVAAALGLAEAEAAAEEQAQEPASRGTLGGVRESDEAEEDEDSDEVEAEEGEAVMMLPDDEPPPVSEAAAVAAAEGAAGGGGPGAPTPAPIMRSISAGLLDAPNDWGVGAGLDSPAVGGARARAFSARFNGGTDSLSLKALLSPLMDPRAGAGSGTDAGLLSPAPPALFGRVRAASYSSTAGGSNPPDTPAAGPLLAAASAASAATGGAGSRRSVSLSMNLAAVFAGAAAAASSSGSAGEGVPRGAGPFVPAPLSRQVSWTPSEPGSVGSRGSGEEALALGGGLPPLPPRSRTGLQAAAAAAAARPSCRISVVVAPSLPGAKARVMIAMEQMPVTPHVEGGSEGSGAPVPRARAPSTGSIEAPLGAPATDGLPDPAGAPSSLDASFEVEDASAAALQVITLPSSSDIFDSKRFLAEAAPLDAIPLLTWVVTSCQHWVLFVQDRYAEMTASGHAGQHHPDLFDLLSFRSEFLRMFRLHSLTRLPSWRMPRGVLYRGVRRCGSSGGGGGGDGSTRVKWWAERYVELAIEAGAGCSGGGPRWVLRVYSDASAVRCIDDALQAGRARLSELATQASDSGKEAEKLASAVRRAEADKKAAFTRRGYTFPLLPGWTRLEYSGESTLKLVNPAPGRCGAGRGLSSTTSLAGAQSASRQVLTLRCPRGVAQRREWVDHLRARLVRPQDIGKLKDAYL